MPLAPYEFQLEVLPSFRGVIWPVAIPPFLRLFRKSTRRPTQLHVVRSCLPPPLGFGYGNDSESEPENNGLFANNEVPR